MRKERALIIGGGVAGLTAALELLEHTDIKPVIFEMTDSVGGISKTVEYQGNRMDIGGHRFFSKSDRVMEWWQKIMPVSENDANDEMDVFLKRSRLSRIFYLRKFFDYPVTLSRTTVFNLGLMRTSLIGFSYLKSALFPVKPEATLEDFFINRFGKKLYQTFFKDYTEKVWGVPCSEIGADWGAQRVKGISVREVIMHAIKNRGGKEGDIRQKDLETSLIERFLYPKYGAGQMWDLAAEKVESAGGEIRLCSRVVGIGMEGGKAVSIKVVDGATGEAYTEEGGYVISSMPVRDLMLAMDSGVPKKVLDTAGALAYRDFISVGILLGKLKLEKAGQPLMDNWIYIQEKDVKMGRIQLFHNWSPHMAADEGNKWLGLEYFCNEGDSFWNMKDGDISEFAIAELVGMGFAERKDVLGSKVVRMPKAYPSYTGSYSEFEIVREFADSIENLFLIGRNGMHRYNNMDHSMLSAMAAVENIAGGLKTRDNIWSVNAEESYHEKK